jgi:hypothetical protein
MCAKPLRSARPPEKTWTGLDLKHTVFCKGSGHRTLGPALCVPALCVPAQCVTALCVPAQCVPAQVSVVGFDELLRLMKQPNAHSRHAVFQPRLILRGSTGTTGNTVYSSRVTVTELVRRGQKISKIFPPPLGQLSKSSDPAYEEACDLKSCQIGHRKRSERRRRFTLRA